ncbi:Wzz/FepE/Etk N-terminal domain-containing protein [Anaerostipes caccae]|uniref:YveK family protein n=1 Tax=Anaerostipes caccae TaxID=105841 RepID=UPI00335187EA
MNENDEIEIDLVDMCKYFVSKWITIVLSILICAGVGFGYSVIKNKKIYSTTAKLYVTIPQTSDKVLIRDNANELVQDYIELMKTNIISEKVANKLKMSSDEVKESIQPEQIEGTRIIKLKITLNDPKKIKKLSNAVITTTLSTITNKLKKDKPLILEQNKKLTVENSVNIKKNTVLSAAGGFLLVSVSLTILFIVQCYKKSLNKDHDSCIE